MEKLKIFIILLVVSGVFMLSSCEKFDATDNQYSNQTEEIDTTLIDWHKTYTFGGVLTTSISAINNPLVGTKWLLTEYRVGFGPIQHPNDTLLFINNDIYTINNGSAKSYRLSSLPMTTSYELTLFYFYPFGSGHYSAKVDKYFVENQQINNAIFTDLDNTSIEIQAYFVRID